MVPLSQRADLVELMDDPRADAAALDRTYALFGLVNAVVGSWGSVFRREILPRGRAADRPVRVLDIGTGGGDMPRALARWARAEGPRVEVLGIDPNERAINVATRHSRFPEVTFRRALSSDLVAEGATFDVVVSNHVLHHLSAPEFGALLADSERLVADGGVALHSDLARSRGAYAAFALGTLPFAGLLAGSFIRPDGLTSIRRAHTVVEMRRMLPPGWRVRGGFPSRLELTWRRELAWRR